MIVHRRLRRKVAPKSDEEDQMAGSKKASLSNANATCFQTNTQQHNSSSSVSESLPLASPPAAISNSSANGAHSPKVGKKTLLLLESSGCVSHDVDEPDTQPGVTQSAKSSIVSSITSSTAFDNTRKSATKIALKLSTITKRRKLKKGRFY